MLVTVIASPGKKENVEMHNKVMTVEENMITTQKKIRKAKRCYR
jgi:hypothetical protein